MDYPQAFQDRLADEIERYLPEGSAIEQALNDYAVERDQLRDCQRGMKHGW